MIAAINVSIIKMIRLQFIQQRPMIDTNEGLSEITEQHHAILITVKDIHLRIQIKDVHYSISPFSNFSKILDNEQQQY